MGGNGADVRNVVAFFEGWDRVDVQDDTGDRSAGFEYNFAEVVGNIADFHALLNIGPTLHNGVPNARAVINFRSKFEINSFMFVLQSSDLYPHQDATQMGDPRSGSEPLRVHPIVGILWQSRAVIRPSVVVLSFMSTCHRLSL